MELELIARLEERLPRSEQTLIGVGDDAALVASLSDAWVVTTDALIDGVHFRSDEHSPQRIGHKALAVNLSDLAAMAARPVACVVSLMLPSSIEGSRERVDYGAQLMEGMLALANRHGCDIVGGDTNVGPGPLVVAVTAFGEPTAHGVLRRDGAKPGDSLLVTGELGGSLAGKHLEFEPRVAEALLLNQRYALNAGMDLSDGLALDLRRLCQASGVGAVVDEASLPIAPAARERSATSGNSPAEHAISDGEDFELLLAAPAGVAERMLEESPIACRVTRVGEVTEGRTVGLRGAEGSVSPLASMGYEHGRVAQEESRHA